MRTSLYLIQLALTVSLAAVSLRGASPTDASSSRITQSFDTGWRFEKADAPGAEQPGFADTSWRAVTVPHDWSIEGPFDQKAPTRGSGAFLPSGVAWYRNAFTLPDSSKARRVFIEFDGVMQNSEVWINGHSLGTRPYGYVSFRYELTGHLNFGANASNVVAVKVDTSKQPASRWYSGAGIYRHVRLVITDPVHIGGWSTFVTTPKAASDSATVRVQTAVLNQGTAPADVAVRVALVGPDGKQVASAVTASQSAVPGGTVPFAQEFAVASPKLWDITSPNLYSAVVTVLSAGTAVDDEKVTFGIRDAHFDSERGFVLNGRKVPMYGVCLHHDGSGFGAAVPLAVWEQRLSALRELGVNSIRTAHNPPDPGFLDLCDRMGFLVMDELFDCWTVAKNPFDYHLYFEEWSKIDVRDTVLRDRNHPSVVFYSAGNEIHDTRNEELAKKILTGLVAEFHQFDPSRPVTQALFRPNVSHDYTNGLADLLDVVGTNYRDPELLVAWKDKPTRKIVGTEQRHDRDTWLAMRDNPQHAGQFLWTGVDYLGEAFMWPNYSSGSGLLDRTGAMKPMAFERQSWWGPKPMVGIVRRVAPNVVSQFDPGYEPATAMAARRRGPTIFRDWTPKNAEAHEENIEIYSNCESVELFLNDVSLGAKPINADASPRAWKVNFAPGTLRAVARNGGKEVATDELKTAGAPARVVLVADRRSVSPAWEDVVRVTATIVDAHGIRVPSADNLVSFTVEGPGAVVVVDSADSTDHEPFQASQRKAFQGACVAYVRASAESGNMTIRATAPNLAPGSTNLKATSR